MSAATLGDARVGDLARVVVRGRSARVVDVFGRAHAPGPAMAGFLWANARGMGTPRAVEREVAAMVEGDPLSGPRTARSDRPGRRHHRSRGCQGSRRCDRGRTRRRQRAPLGAHRRRQPLRAARHGRRPRRRAPGVLAVCARHGGSDAAGPPVERSVQPAPRGPAAGHQRGDDRHPRRRGPGRALLSRGDRLRAPADLPRGRRALRRGAPGCARAREYPRRGAGRRRAPARPPDRARGARDRVGRAGVGAGVRSRRGRADRAPDARAPARRGLHDRRQRGGGPVPDRPQDAGRVPVPRRPRPVPASSDCMRSWRRWRSRRRHCRRATSARPSAGRPSGAPAARSRRIWTRLRARGERDGSALWVLVLRALKQAFYSADAWTHSGLGEPRVPALHLADPPLPGPAGASGADRRARDRRRGAQPSGARGRRGRELGRRARRDRPGAQGRPHLRGAPARAGAERGRLDGRVRRRGDRAHRHGRVPALRRRVRGLPAPAPGGGRRADPRRRRGRA